MVITLSKRHLYFDALIQDAAKAAGCYASIKWATPTQVRFVLVERAASKIPASFDVHEKVIEGLLARDPHAKIRTAIAIFNGQADYQARRSRAPA